MTWLTTCLARCASYALDNHTDRKRVAREILHALPAATIRHRIYEAARAAGTSEDMAHDIADRSYRVIVKILTGVYP